MGTDGNEIVEQLATEGPSHPLIGPESALGTSVKVARGVIRYRMNRKHEKCWQSICEPRQAKAFLKKTICHKSWRTAQSEQKPAKNNDRAANRTLSFKRTTISNGAAKQSQAGNCKAIPVQAWTGPEVLGGEGSQIS